MPSGPSSPGCSPASSPRCPINRADGDPFRALSGTFFFTRRLHCRFWRVQCVHSPALPTSPLSTRVRHGTHVLGLLRRRRLLRLPDLPSPDLGGRPVPSAGAAAPGEGDETPPARLRVLHLGTSMG